MRGGAGCLVETVVHGFRYQQTRDVCWGCREEFEFCFASSVLFIEYWAVAGSKVVACTWYVPLRPLDTKLPSVDRKHIRCLTPPDHVTELN